MKIQENFTGSALTLQLSGELDLTGAPELTEYLNGKLTGVESLTLDMADVTYLSSAGMRAVLTAQRAMEGKTFKIIRCNQTVYEVFNITGIINFLDVEKA